MSRHGPTCQTRVHTDPLTLVGQLDVAHVVQQQVGGVEVADDDLSVVEAGQHRSQLSSPGPLDWSVVRILDYDWSI